MTAQAATIPPNTCVLVVEDSKATRRIFKSLLKSLGMTVLEASDGDEAFVLLKERIPEIDIVYTDISMPNMDGFELCYKVQQASWYDGTPLVMVSTQSDAANVIRSLKLGAEDYLPKPFNKDDLLRITGRVLNHG